MILYMIFVKKKLRDRSFWSKNFTQNDNDDKDDDGHDDDHLICLWAFTLYLERSASDQPIMGRNKI